MTTLRLRHTGFLATLTVIVLALLMLRPSQTRADVFTDYTVNFTVTSGSPTPSGSFVFDDTTHLVASYIINWNTAIFDYTGVFDMFPFDPTTTGTWTAITDATHSSFTLTTAFYSFNLNDPPGAPLAQASGTFTVSPSAAVPEPAALALMGTALAVLFLFVIGFRAHRRECRIQA